MSRILSRAKSFVLSLLLRFESEAVITASLMVKPPPAVAKKQAARWLPDRPALPRNHTRTRTHTCASAADRHASSTAAVTSLCKHAAACVWETVSDGVRLFVSECVWLARRVCVRVCVCVCASS